MPNRGSRSLKLRRIENATNDFEIGRFRSAGFRAIVRHRAGPVRRVLLPGPFAVRDAADLCEPVGLRAAADRRLRAGDHVSRSGGRLFYADLESGARCGAAGTGWRASGHDAGRGTIAGAFASAGSRTRPGDASARAPVLGPIPHAL